LNQHRQPLVAQTFDPDADDRRLPRLRQGEQRMEIRVQSHDNALLGAAPLEDFPIFGPRQANERRICAAPAEVF
jgi:hypothetical protein